MNPKAAKCLIRFVEEDDFLRLESIYADHEGESLPSGYFENFREAIRSDEVIYFIAEVDGQVVGGGGISQYFPGSQATLTFGVVEKRECRKGYGTAILLARLAFIHPGSAGCHIMVEATERSVDFFSRLGFKWHLREKDEMGNHFFQGSHMVYPGDTTVFRSILEAGEVTLIQEIEDIISAEQGVAPNT